MQHSTIKTIPVRLLTWVAVLLGFAILTVSVVNWYQTKQGGPISGKSFGWLFLLVSAMTFASFARCYLTGTMAAGAITRQNQPVQFGFYLGFFSAVSIAMLGFGLLKSLL